MRIRFLSGMGAPLVSVWDDNLLGVFGKRRHEPTKERRGGSGPGYLGDDESRGIGWPYAGERVGGGAREGYGWIRKRG